MKAIPEDNQRFLLKNQLQRPWGSAPPASTQLGLVWLASTNTGCFLVGSIDCWSLQTPLRRQCYHSCDTESVQEWKKGFQHQCLPNFGQWLVTDHWHRFFCVWKKISIVLLACSSRASNLSKLHLLLVWAPLLFIGLWVKITHRNKSLCCKSNPVLQTSKSKSTACLKKQHLLRFQLNSNRTLTNSYWK